MIQRLLKGLAPIAALAMGAALSGCNKVDMTINGKEGVPLAELDMAGAVPSELVVATNAKVIVTQGDTLGITVENDPETALRFVLDDATLGVTRDADQKLEGGTAIVRVTMPAPKSIVIAGAGSVEADSVGTNPELTIGGSGSIAVTRIAAETLEVAIGGSGSVKGAGTARHLEITIGGSGDVEFANLNADKAEISIGGSGNVTLASDGEVEANIAGSGDINVTGSAKCTANSLGSGKLSCAAAAHTAR